MCSFTAARSAPSRPRHRLRHRSRTSCWPASSPSSLWHYWFRTSTTPHEDEYRALQSTSATTRVPIESNDQKDGCNEAEDHEHQQHASDTNDNVPWLRKELRIVVERLRRLIFTHRLRSSNVRWSLLGSLLVLLVSRRRRWRRRRCSHRILIVDASLIALDALAAKLDTVISLSLAVTATLILPCSSMYVRTYE